MKNDIDLIGDFIEKKCPKCGSSLLGNKNGDEWCSYILCDYKKDMEDNRQPIWDALNNSDA